jgi:hypothetical protein
MSVKELFMLEVALSKFFHLARKGIKYVKAVEGT